MDQYQHQEMRDTVRRLALAEFPKYQNDSWYGTVPRELFSACAGLGLAGVNIPEQFGGIAAPPTLTLAVLEELAAVDLGPAIFISVHAMVCGIIARSGNDLQKQRILPRLASGEALGAFALTEPAAGSDAKALRSQVTSVPGGYKLRGEKCYITSAGWADLYVVFARHATAPSNTDPISAFLLEPSATTTGLNICAPEKKMGCELSPIASLQFDDLFLPQESLLGAEGDGYKIALSGLASGRIGIAGCANGLSRAAIERAQAHVTDREQFGQKLAEFQGLQFMLADMRMQYEAARLLTREAAIRLEETPTSRDNRLYPSMAKCFATDAAMRITTDAVQLLGGSGYIREYQVERLMRDAKMLQIVEGTNQIQRGLIAREMFR